MHCNKALSSTQCAINPLGNYKEVSFARNESASNFMTGCLAILTAKTYSMNYQRLIIALCIVKNNCKSYIVLQLNQQLMYECKLTVRKFLRNSPIYVFSQNLIILTKTSPVLLNLSVHFKQWVICHKTVQTTVQNYICDKLGRATGSTEG